MSNSTYKKNKTVSKNIKNKTSAKTAKNNNSGLKPKNKVVVKAKTKTIDTHQEDEEKKKTQKIFDFISYF